MMDKNILWNDFEITGKVEDYLKYKKNEAKNVLKNEEENETNKN